MPYIRDALLKGHYRSHRKQPYGFWKMNGFLAKGAIGHRSQLQKELKKHQIDLQTVYFGNVDKNEQSLIIYNKKSELWEREQKESEYQTRIEYRLNFRLMETKPWGMISMLLATYHEFDRFRLRTCLFATYLLNRIEFVFKRQGENQNRPLSWWQTYVIDVLERSGGMDEVNFAVNCYTGKTHLSLPQSGGVIVVTPRKRGRPQKQEYKYPLQKSFVAYLRK